MMPTHCYCDARVGLQVVMPAEEVEQAALEELGGSPDELGQLFAVKDDRERLALGRLEEDGADLHRLDGMLARRRDEVDVFDALRLSITS